METPTKKVAVVILNYNGIHWLKKFLGDVIKKTTNAELVIADNASTDNSVVELVDTRDSKSLFRKKVSVRVRSVVLYKHVYNRKYSNLQSMKSLDKRRHTNLQ